LALLEGYGDAEALVGTYGQRLTYADVRRGVITMAAALWRHGIGDGTAIGILARNPHESIFLQLGAHLLGCRTAWIASHTPPRSRDRVLTLAQVDAFIYDADIFPELGPELAAYVDVPVLCFAGEGIGPNLSAEPETDVLRSTPARSRANHSRFSRPAAPPAIPNWSTTGTCSSKRCKTFRAFIWRPANQTSGICLCPELGM
jgi:acyl-CoA synthetase (AMP-forming)/AMP-acid ligase II